MFGIYATGAGTADVNGVIYYGKEDSGEYKANTTGMGYQEPRVPGAEAAPRRRG